MRRCAWTVVAGALAAGLVAMPAHAAAVKSSGEVAVVEASGSSRTRNSGGSATVFSLRLPRDSTCPGDSADDNYRVQSFLVPAGTDPGSVRYKSQGPDVPGGWAVYKTTTNAYIQEMTADAPKKGDPGPIIDLPDLSFAVFTGGELTPGTYEMGVACSLWNETVKYWSTTIVVQQDSNDAPARLRWRLANATSESAGSSRVPMVVGGGLVAVAIGALVIRRRRTT